MKTTLLIGLLASGCVSASAADYPPGKLGLLMDSSVWIQGEPTNIWLNFDYDCAPGDFQCPRTPMTVLDVACDGCEILEDPTGSAPALKPRIRVVATVDGPIEFKATIRATGEERQLSTSVTGDHEVALEAECALSDTSALNENLSKGGAGPFRTCEAPRLPSETVVLFPVIRTFSGGRRFPFCSSRSNCTTWDGKQLRPLSSLSIEPAPTGWGRSYASPEGSVFFGDFAILPPLQSTHTVSLSAPLATGEISTTSVAIPPSD